MRRTATGIGLTLALAGGVVMSGVGTPAAMAQGAPGALQGILAALEQLQASITGVQQSVDALGATSNFLFTPVVIVESGIVDCNHVNVTATDKHVLTQLIDASTGDVVSQASAVVPTLPGRSRAAGAFSPVAISGHAYCKFTVEDGTKADIRANLTLTPNIGGIETTTVSVAAE